MDGAWVNTVILMGDDWRQSIRQHILRQLRPYFHVVAVGGGKAIETGQGKRLLFIDADGLQNIDLEGAAVVLGPKAKLLKTSRIASGCYIVADSANAKQLAWLSGKNLKTISCGLSQKDTLTVSSRKEESCAVSLQRTLKICRKELEPMELLVSCEGEKDAYPILAAAACTLLTGAYEKALLH